MTHIRECVFQDIFANEPGSAVSCISQIDVDVASCIFLNCSSSHTGISSVRPSQYASGGACYFDVSKMNISNCYFFKCFSSGLGAALYSAGPITETCNASCLSSFMCFSQKTQIHSIYAFECFTTTLTSLNSTNDIQNSHYSIVHIGRNPSSYFFELFMFFFSFSGK